MFFRILNGPPLGALGLPVTGGVTVAADVKFIPLGAPVFLSMDRVDATGLWIAQDTGGAIKGSNRVDTFWGSGREARGDRRRHVGARHGVPAGAGRDARAVAGRDEWRDDASALTKRRYGRA